MLSQIIDTHLHAWDFRFSTYHWLKGNETILNRSYFVEELDQQRLETGVRSCVLVQADNTFEDTDLMLLIADRSPFISGVVGWLPLADPAAASAALIEKYLSNKYFKGVRHLINDEVDERWLLQEEVIESLRMLASHNIPYDLVGITTGHIRTALALAEKVPGLRMVFDHLNQPPIKTRELGEWGTLMKQAAQHRNFHVKISGLGTASGSPQHWTAKDLEPYITFALEHFTVDRCFCGGDWPVSLLAGSYAKHWQAYTEIINSLLNEQEAQRVFFANAVSFYDLQNL